MFFSISAHLNETKTLTDREIGGFKNLISYEVGVVGAIYEIV